MMVDFLLQTGAFFKGKGPCHCAEGGKPYFQSHRPGREPLLSEPLGYNVAVDGDFPVYDRGIGNVLFIGRFIAYGFDFPLRFHRTVIYAEGKPLQKTSLIPQNRCQRFHGGILDIPYGPKACLHQAAFRHLSHTPEPAHRQGPEDVLFLPVGMMKRPSGLSMSLAILARNLLGAMLQKPPVPFPSGFPS